MAETTGGKAADAAHEALNEGAKSAANAEKRVRQAVSDAEDGLRDSAAYARQKSSEISNALNDYVREHPLGSLWIAFATGMVALAILRR